MANTEQDVEPGVEQGGRTALPLAQAALRLGISTDALRMRIRRGKAEGFKREGHVFVYLSRAQAHPGADPGADPGAEARQSAGPTEQRPNAPGGFRFRDSSEPRQGGPGTDPMSVVIEFQKVELTRLLKENDRLNRRLDQQLDEVHRLREMLQREQVLRQQEHSLRQQLQHILERLTERLALPRPEPEVLGEVHEVEEPGEAERPPAAPGAAAQAARGAPPAPESEGPEADAPEAPEPPPGEVPPAGTGMEGAEPARTRGAAEATELAEMLKDIGQSLRALETRPARPSAGSQGSGERDPERDPERDSECDLDELGLWDEDRRNAARMMRKLFRNRTTPRPRDS